MRFWLQLTRVPRGTPGEPEREERHSEEVEGPDLEFVLAHASVASFFAEQDRIKRATIEVELMG